MQDKLAIATEIQELLCQYLQSASRRDAFENRQRVSRIKSLFAQLKNPNLPDCPVQQRPSFRGDSVLPY